MHRFLADHVHAVRIGTDLIVLDLVADTYTAVSLVETDVELDPLGRGLSAGVDALRDFEAAGLLSPDAAVPQRGIDLPEPRSGVQASQPPGVADVLQFALGIGAVARRCRRATLGALTREAGRRARASGGREETLRRARIFPALLAWSPWDGECLFRSYALLRFLRAGGCDARWVFGVRTWPFAAHCWLQVDDVVLNDHPDRLTAYEPILVV